MINRRVIREMVVWGEFAQVPIFHKGKVVYSIIDRQDIPKVKDYNWTYSHGYAIASMHKHGKDLRMHRVIMDAPEGLEVDHRNHNKFAKSIGQLTFI